MAFIRWSGVRPLMEAIRAHCAEGKTFRVLTTVYTNSTEQRALDELRAAGADIRVSYDTSLTRLHAKAWVFHRASGYSTAYIGSSNLTHTAQVSGIEWNVRVSAVRNPDAVDKMVAVFESYWESGGFVEYDPVEFAGRTAVSTNVRTASAQSGRDRAAAVPGAACSSRSRSSRHTAIIGTSLVAATGTGKTVMAAVDYARLRQHSPRDRLLFVAHREEILEQSRCNLSPRASRPFLR